MEKECLKEDWDQRSFLLTCLPLVSFRFRYKYQSFCSSDLQDGILITMGSCLLVRKYLSCFICFIGAFIHLLLLVYLQVWIDLSSLCPVLVRYPENNSNAHPRHTRYGQDFNIFGRSASVQYFDSDGRFSVLQCRKIVFKFLYNRLLSRRSRRNSTSIHTHF